MAKVARARFVAILLLASLVVAACGPADRTAADPGEPGSRPQKTLTMAILGEPVDFYGGGLGGVKNVPPIALDTLVVLNPQGQPQPLLAAELISVEAGTWRVNPDATMDTTWKIRPEVKWHDGSPFTSADLLFTLAVRQDPAIPVRTRGGLNLVRSATAPDPLTFALHWSAPFADANLALALEPLPKHLLEDTYLHEKEGFINSLWLSSQFVGQGPYRLEQWDRGSHMVFARFDAYYQGRPPLDRVVVNFMADQNAMVASILSGAIDILLSGVGVDAALDVQRRWAGTGNVVRFDLTGGLWKIDIQHRPEVARPKDGLTNSRVREAFYRAIDREVLAEVVGHGLAPIADSWIPPTSALRPVLEPLIPQFAYDPARAQQLLAAAGWARGADGTLVSTVSGQRFETELRAQPDERGQLMRIVASQWQEIGAQVSEQVLTPAQRGNYEYAALYPGGVFGGSGPDKILGGGFHTPQIASAANRWRGRNDSGYSDPRVDALFDRLAVTINPNDQTALHGELVQALMGDVVIMPLLWTVLPVLQMKGVKSHQTADGVTTWNFFEFDKD